jgi:hypothetical protein
MNNLPAATGWLWVKQGFHYFKQQPMEFCTLFLAYLFSMLLLGFIPVLGQLLAFIFMPLFTLAFMQACREIDQGLRVHPRLLLYTFRLPEVSKLMMLGALYLLAAGIALGASTLVDDGVFWQFITGKTQLTETLVEESSMTSAMLFALLVYSPALMAFWFAGPLIAWQKMSLPKAIFYSFFASIKTLRVFFVYGLSWFAVAGILPSIISLIAAAFTGNPNTVLVIMMPLSMVLTVILYCSFYPTYKSVFGPPADAASSTIS